MTAIPGLLVPAATQAQKFEITPVIEKKVSQLPPGPARWGKNTDTQASGVGNFYILSGELTQKTPHGVSHVSAGQSMPGHPPNTPMQVSSSATSELSALVMFVNDATKPFSSPATME